MVSLIRGDGIEILKDDGTVRVAGYFRLADKTDIVSVKNCLTDRIEKRSDFQKAWCCIGLYCDKPSERHSFQKMMSDANKGLFDILLTESIEHFAPTAEETIQTVEELRSLPTPVRVIFLKDGVDSETVHAVAQIVRGWRP